MNTVKSTGTASAAWFIGEFLGTFLLVFCGCGIGATALLSGGQVSPIQVAVAWGLGVTAAIYLTGGLSGAHLNPAVTVAFATWAGFPWRQVPRYIFAQFVGAFAASVTLYTLSAGMLHGYETTHGIIRGAAGSEATAMIFGEYFPNPGGRPLTDAARATMPAMRAFFCETLGTAVLALVVFGCSEERNRWLPRILVPAIIGLTVTFLILLIGPLTMAALNPARDLAPRLFSALAGWGSVPFTANGYGWLTVYVMAPLTGAVAGGGVYRWWRATRNPADAGGN